MNCVLEVMNSSVLLVELCVYLLFESYVPSSSIVCVCVCICVNFVPVSGCMFNYDLSSFVMVRGCK